MKKAFLIIALFAGSVTFSNAQQGQQRSPQERAKMQVSRLAESVKLTDDQKAKIEAIYLGQANSMDSLRKAAGDDRQGAFAKMAPIREEADKKISALLNEEQKKEYATYQQESRKRMMGPGGRRPGGNGQQPAAGN